MEVYKTTLGEKHPDTLVSMHNLALRYSEAGRRQEALQLTEQVVEVYKRTLGEEYPETTTSINPLTYLKKDAMRERNRLMTSTSGNKNLALNIERAREETQSLLTRLWKKLK